MEQIKTTPDPAVITSWVQELRRLEAKAAAIGERRLTISRLIELYRPPAKTPATTATTGPRKAPPPARTSTSSSTRERSKAGETSKRVIAHLPVGVPGITQRDLQTRLPGIRANVIGRIVENAASHGTAIKEGEGPTARYWRPERQSTSAAAE
jgi:hypothetical protein